VEVILVDLLLLSVSLFWLWRFEEDCYA